jgi:large subunit ribosomal protein L1
MGKIRIKAFDEASVEDEAKLKAKKEAKKAEKMAAKNAAKAAAGKKTNPQTDGTMKTVEDEIVVETVIPESSEEITVETVEPSSAKATEGQGKKAKKEKFAKAKAKVDSKRHKENMTVVSASQKYDLDQALATLKKFKSTKFDETVELHINTKEKGVNGTVTLPHGTGKTLVIKVADEKIIEEVAKGKINFDLLVAQPSMMPQLAKVARVLGPRGLMPNPKNGTIAENTAEAVKKLSGGQISYKTEAEAPIIHARVGKISFEDNKLKDNVKTFISSVGVANIASVTLKSTMSPAIRLNIV